MEYKNTFDSFDIVLSFALMGGFLTGNWIPAFILFLFSAMVAIFELRGKK